MFHRVVKGRMNPQAFYHDNVMQHNTYPVGGAVSALLGKSRFTAKYKFHSVIWNH